MSNQTHEKSNLARSKQKSNDIWRINMEKKPRETSFYLNHNPIVDAINGALHSNGQPLDKETKTFMEPHFGRDFSKVRIHTGEKAGTSAKAMNAQAYTVGQNVIFGYGRYNPDTSEGQRLIAHELVHVAQQEDNPNRNGNDLIIQRFAEPGHKEVEDLSLSRHPFTKEEREQIEMGNWQTDINQISELNKYLSKSGLTLTDDDFFKIGSLLGEAKFGGKVSAQMKKERFGKYDPKQHFDRPDDQGLENKAMPSYILKNVDALKESFHKSIYAYSSEGPNVAMEYFGTALHTIEDFFAHTNFVEIALNLKGREVDTYAGKTSTGEFRLISGNFKFLDVLISFGKMLLQYMSEPYNPKKGKTTGDKILIIFLRRQNPVVAKAYEYYLDANEIMIEAIPGYKDILKLIQYYKKYYANILAQAIYLMEVDKKAAELTEKASHSNINKDDPSRQGYQLARDLAVHVVNVLTPIMRDLWHNPKDERKIRDLDDKIKLFTSYPKKGDWWDPIVGSYLRRMGRGKLR